jgi:hypothetical protein
MDLGSYSDELPPDLGLSESAQEEFGHLPQTAPWETFYEMATASKNVYLVKTHLPPRDNQPAIYVVRDGRSSLVSYQKYHQRFFPEYSGGLIELVLGADYYGGWSEHHAKWMSGGRKTFLLRYEELGNASPVLLQSIAEFISHEGPVTAWLNPFQELQKENPDFFRVGKTEWQGAPEWSEFINGIFLLLHGDLMKTLGYMTQDALEEARASMSPELIKFIVVAQSIQFQKAILEKICQERLSATNTLGGKRKKLGVRNLMPLSLLKRLVLWGR